MFTFFAGLDDADLGKCKWSQTDFDLAKQDASEKRAKSSSSPDLYSSPDAPISLKRTPKRQKKFRKQGRYVHLHQRTVEWGKIGPWGKVGLFS